MAYVTVPKDLTHVKSKVLFGLTKRQLVCFGGALLTGGPLYFLARNYLSNSAAALLMIFAMLPGLLFALFERHGQPLEVVIQQMIQCCFMRAKVPKAGSVLLSGVVIGLIEFLIGAGWAVAVGFIAGAVIAELLARIGHYKSFWLNTIGYSVYMMFFALGTYLPMVIMTGYVDDMSTSNGVSAEYLTELHSFMNGTMVVIIAVVTFVAGIVGALIAKGVFKKHFQKAGIV